MSVYSNQKYEYLRYILFRIHLTCGKINYYIFAEKFNDLLISYG